MRVEDLFLLTICGRGGLTWVERLVGCCRTHEGVEQLWSLVRLGRDPEDVDELFSLSQLGSFRLQSDAGLGTRRDCRP